jgi:UDP-glucose 4-epimerase
VSRVLITGASGFLGRAVSRQLSAAGHDVVGQSRAARPDDDIRWRQADLSDAAAVVDLLAAVRPTVVVNLAGVSDGRPDVERVIPSFAGNGQSTVHLLYAASGIGCRVIHIGSLQEPLDVVAASPYALSKWVASAYVDFFERQYALPTITLRFGIVYGPGEASTGRLVPHAITTLLRGEAPRLSNGLQSSDWLYIDDAAGIIAAAVRAQDVRRCRLDVGSGRPATVRTVITTIATHVGGTGGNPVEPLFGVLPDRPLVATRPADPEGVFQALGWRPAVDLEEGLRRTVDWYRRRSG